jgi:hypothetical protein
MRSTHVAPAKINSNVRAFVKADRMARYRAVESMIINSRAIMLVVVVQIATGSSKRKLIRNNSKTFAVRLIKRPEYIYTFSSLETLCSGIYLLVSMEYWKLHHPAIPYENLDSSQ